MRELRPPRYLAPFDSDSVPHRFTSVLVIGSGAAGLRAAIEASRYAPVVVVTKDELKASNTDWAQGGIAAAVGPDDSVEQHLADTLEVGGGLGVPEAARFIVGQAAERIHELADWGAEFDRDGDRLALTREGGHSRERVVHARGDATGAEVEKTLIERLGRCPNLRTLEHTYVIDLLGLDNECLGAVTWSQARGLTLVWAEAVVLATGGAGQVFRETTNPRIATGDGLAMAYRAGCELRDLEFVQFHPTTLYVAGAARVLISEAARGEGGVLVNKYGERFMEKYSPMKELAPRDVVSRAILAEMQQTGDTNVYLDLTHVDAARLAARFPQIKEFCSLFDINIHEDRIPVCPSAHYMIGGVRTDLNGATSVDRLFACGEVGWTGLHGANRLGSNSLLEALAMGKSAGAAAGKLAAGGGTRSTERPPRIEAEPRKPGVGAIDLDDVRSSVRSNMWRNVGMVRHEQGLGRALERLAFWSGYVLERGFNTPRGWRIQNMLILARQIAKAALAREESRGVHYRADFPDSDPEPRHSIIRPPAER
ncbi:MAG: L-aspartate oxidase [Planctomycetota bacterium]